MYEMNLGPTGVKMWLPWDELDPMAREQIVNVANHPELAGHVAIMPDSHGGFGVPIGCVFWTEGSIIPNAVGVDQGCGMQAVRTSLQFDPERMDRAFWDTWAHSVERGVPTGFGQHQKPKSAGDYPQFGARLHAEALQKTMESKAPAQLGTLGGGNHFLEAQVDEAGYIWVMVHSGSRGTGNQLARHYHKLAVIESEERGLKAPKDLSSLSFEGETAQHYLSDLEWSLWFARTSRTIMVDQMLSALEHTAKLSFDTSERTDCMHNYAEDNVGPTKMVIHRKGATYASPHVLSIIPGSMGAKSYILRGRPGEALDASFNSCSHGAGRLMSRTEAKRSFEVETVNDELAGTFTTITKGQLDEAPGAYKDISAVIERQADIVEVVHELRPLRTIKGDSRAKDD